MIHMYRRKRERRKCGYDRRDVYIQYEFRNRTYSQERVDKNIIIALNLFVIRFAFDEHGYALRVRCDNKINVKKRLVDRKIIFQIVKKCSHKIRQVQINTPISHHFAEFFFVNCDHQK